VIAFTPLPDIQGGLPPVMARQPGDDPEAAAWAVLQSVPDPEIPAVSVCDLGIVRALQFTDAGLDVVLTPTYSGCPATEQIDAAVRQALQVAGFGPVTVRHQLSPAWTSDWISPQGRERLRRYGIAPPHVMPTDTQGAPAAVVSTIRIHARGVACPRCESPDTERLSAFGSTACKSLYRCLACREPFEHFKTI
jgi:ring-1,2-phenylacetyl-CoA epoxidase subunit PaaD